MKPVLSLNLYDLGPRKNVHVDDSTVGRTTARLIVETAALAFILVVIGILVMA